ERTDLPALRRLDAAACALVRRVLRRAVLPERERIEGRCGGRALDRRRYDGLDHSAGADRVHLREPGGADHRRESGRESVRRDGARRRGRRDTRDGDLGVTEDHATLDLLADPRFERLPCIKSREHDVRWNRDVQSVPITGRRAAIEYLYGTTGSLRAFLEDELRRRLFDGSEVRDVVLRYVDSTYRLALRLTPEAGASHEGDEPERWRARD